jgi:signal transduction histidine kinase
MFNPFKKFDYFPIRVKLTVWYTLSFMTVLAFSFASFFLVTKNLMLSKIDESLVAQSEEVVNLIKAETISPLSKGLILKTFQVTKTNFVLVLNEKNEIVAQSITFPIDQEFISHLSKDTEEKSTPHFFTLEKIRFHMTPIYVEDQLIGVVIVGDSLSTINEAFQVLLNTLVLVFLIFLLPMILISFLEAEISLSPLRDLAKKMNTINTKNLSDRVKVLNPKDEIGEVGTAFNSLLDRIQKAFVKERQLIHDVSHQLKTPLTAIRSDIEIVLTKKRNILSYQNTLKNLLADSSRIDSLLKDMMNFAWASSEEQEKSFSAQNLSNILREACEITSQIGLEKKLKVVTSIEKNIMVRGQKEKLFQIFINILENAAKYSPKNGKIIIKATTEDRSVKIIVKDNGMGIAKKDLPNIFDRFFRADNKNGEGSGLGLSITAALVKAHNGTIDVTSQKGKGTTFLITLPIIKKVKKNKKKSTQRPVNILPISIKRSKK